MLVNYFNSLLLRRFHPLVCWSKKLQKGPVYPVIKKLSAFGFTFEHKSLIRNMSCCGNSCGVDLSKDALKKRLTSMQYQVTQEKETERAFTGKYFNHFEKGTYVCIVCNQDIFSSEAKFDSKCGWPAFSDVVDIKNVSLKKDLSHHMQRTEVCCSKCGSHLGHVFDDGPKPTGKRYCINSAALDFRKAEESCPPDSSTKS